MILTLQRLINEAKAAASMQPIWEADGGRTCPIGWWDCSQAVYKDLATGAYDHGEPDGPGWKDCQDYCKHGLQPAPPEDEDEDKSWVFPTVAISYTNENNNETI